MDNDSIFNNLIIKDIKNKYNIYKNVGDGIINSNFFFIPLVITIFSLYFSFIQRKIGKSYDKEYKEKIVVLKNKEEDSDVIDEAWDKMKNKYDKLRNQQFNIFLVALLKCVLSYENLIGASFIVYCFYKVSEGYNLYKIDIKYLNKRLLKNKNNEEEFKKIVLEKIQVKMRFRHSTFHTMFYTFTLFFGYYLTKCRGFWDVTKMSNPIDPNSIIMNYIFGIKNVCTCYFLIIFLYVILYRLFVEITFNIFDDFTEAFISSFKLRKNIKFMVFFAVICSLCLLKSALVYH